jgi:hypothetical protein
MPIKFWMMQNWEGDSPAYKAGLNLVWGGWTWPGIVWLQEGRWRTDGSTWEFWSLIFLCQWFVLWSLISHSNSPSLSFYT